MEQRIELFSPERISQLRRKTRYLTVSTATLAGLVFCACVLLCCFAEPRSSDRTELTIIVLFTLGGWVFLYRWRYVLLPARRTLRHAEMLQAGERTAFEGRITVTSDPAGLSAGFPVARVLLTEADGPRRRFLVHADRADVLSRQTGSLRLWTVNNYVAAYAPTDPAAPVSGRGPRSKRTPLRFLKNLAAQLPAYLILLILSAVLWSWLFGLATDVPPAKRVTLYIDADAVQDAALAEALEPALPAGLKQVQAHPFSYAMFDESALLAADLYLVPVSLVSDYRDSFVGDGVQVYDAATDTGAARSYVTYTLDGQPQDYYLFLGANSPHLADGAAQAIADQLLTLP